MRALPLGVDVAAADEPSSIAAASE